MEDRARRVIYCWRFQLYILVVFTLASVFAAPISSAFAGKGGGGTAYDLIAAVNALRASRGLQAYQVNGSLMAAAQGHSEYQAAIGSATHTGRGGSTIKTRALAAGYGDGADVNVNENIAMGMNMTPQQALSVWQDAVHMATMLSTSATDVGAGVAVRGDTVFYTLDVGYISGEATGASANSAASGAKPPAAANKSTGLVMLPVQVSTQNPDGSVIHIVGAGQALWNIAAIYKMKLADLLALNNLTEKSFIRPGQKLLIKPGTKKAAPAAATLSGDNLVPLTAQTPISTPLPGSFETATPQPDAVVLAPAQDQPLSQSVEVVEPARGDQPPRNDQPAAQASDSQGEDFWKSIEIDPVLIGILSLFVVGGGLFFFGTVSRQKET